MNIFRGHAVTTIVGIVVLYFYHNWFSKGILTAPDFPYVTPLQLQDLRDIPLAWSSMFGAGFGGSTLQVLNLETYLRLGVRFLVFIMHIPWNAAYRMLFFWPFVLVGSASSFYFCYATCKNKSMSALGTLIYMTNTYVLMLAGGGQVGLMMAYAFIPLSFAAFMRRETVVFVIATAFLLLFDLRFSFLAAGMMVLYGLLVVPKSQWIALLRWSFTPLFIIIGLHSFWLVPAAFGGGVSLPEGFGSADWLKFLSWAEFSKTLSLLHPNWPENIFGKTYFFQPEFIAFPVVAFSALLFLRSVKQIGSRKQILFFSFVAIIGAFMSKGVNPPLGNINEWLFLHAPFFSGFRDPTKFYVLTILSYSILIPFALQKIAETIERHFPKHGRQVGNVIPVIFVAFWLLATRALVMGYVGGTFTKITVPPVYEEFGKFAYSENTFGRTLAVPWRNRFIFQSENHPVIDARDVFQTTDMERIALLFREPSTEMKLRQLAVKYVIVPNDFTNEIFLKDRRPDAESRIRLVRVLDSLSYLDKKKRFDGLDYYEFTKFTGHFFTILPNLDAVPYVARRVSPVLYSVDVTVPYRPADVIFSEAYDPAWELWDGEKIVHPHKTPDGVMAFTIDSDVTGQLSVHNKNQRGLHLGFTVTCIFLALMILLGYLRISKKFGLGLRAHMLLLVLGGGLYVVFTPFSTTSQALFDSDIWWSKEWSRADNPILNTSLMVSRYGGAEMRFRVVNSKEITFTVSSSNNESHIQGVDVIVDGKTITTETPMHDTLIRVDTSESRKTPIDVLVRHWCAGTLGPCDVAITDIQIDKGASIEASATQKEKILAVLGDSISVSFGNVNYTYRLAQKLGYQLHNASIFGSTVVEAQGWDWSMKRYPRDIIAYSPDVLLIFLGTNDLLHDTKVFRNNYSSMLREIQEKSPNTQIITFGLLRRKDFTRAQVTSMSRRIASIAQEHGVLYIDPFYWLEETDLQDVVHPSPESQQKFADKFYEIVSEMIKK